MSASLSRTLFTCQVESLYRASLTRVTLAGAMQPKTAHPIPSLATCLVMPCPTHPKATITPGFTSVSKESRVVKLWLSTWGVWPRKVSSTRWVCGLFTESVLTQWNGSDARVLSLGTTKATSRSSSRILSLISIRIQIRPFSHGLIHTLMSCPWKTLKS